MKLKDRSTSGRNAAKDIAPLGSSSASTQSCAQPIRLIPIERAGEILGLKDTAVRGLTTAGKLRVVKFGSGRRAAARYIEAEIFAFAWSLVAAQSSDPAPVRTGVESACCEKAAPASDTSNPWHEDLGAEHASGSSRTRQLVDINLNDWR